MVNNSTELQEIYYNAMQLNAEIVDANILIIEGGRGVGKTEGVLGPRTMRVAADIPRETSVLAHKTYVALLSNIVPNLIAYYNSPRGKDEKPLLREGIDFVIGEKICLNIFKNLVSRCSIRNIRFFTQTATIFGW